MADKKTVRLGVNLPEDLRDRFKKIAVLNDTDMGALIREWIEEYVSDYAKPKPQKKRIRRKKAGVENGEENTKTKDSEK